MKRSQINTIINESIELLHSNNIKLPPFGYWTPAQWKTKGAECDEIRDCMLGWDVTDFGSGNFDQSGLVLFTTRNGHTKFDKYAAKSYSEKILIIGERQMTPMHFHWVKQEDIINRGGGNLQLKLYNKTKDNTLDDSDIEISLDGVKHTIAAGSIVTLTPGESITLPVGLFHEFWAEPGKGKVISFEVANVNDDMTDNFILDKIRFPDIEEDCEPTHYLCTDYGKME